MRFGKQIELGESKKYGSGITRVINLFHNTGLNPPKFEIMGCGLKVTVFAKNGAASATNEELAKIIGNITIDGIRYHINKMKKANLIVRRNGKKEGYWEIID